jgi:hypothetical protein
MGSELPRIIMNFMAEKIEMLQLLIRKKEMNIHDSYALQLKAAPIRTF